MDSKSIHRHWSNWAETYGGDYRATTRSETAKRLEIDALRRRLTKLLATNANAHILEVGCGNGVNCIALAHSFPGVRFDGLDYVAAMVETAARDAETAGLGERLRFFVGDATRIAEVEDLASSYDLVFTDRCLINLKSAEEQGEAIAALAGKIAPGGHLLMIENSVGAFDAQNEARELLGLPSREPAPFNRFIREEEMDAHIAGAGLQLLDLEDFASLHDLLLYAILPATNGGKIDYDHPLVLAAAELSMALSAEAELGLGRFGQNCLYVCQRPSV